MAESEPALLRQYVRTQDALAFRALVEQHQDMVFAACHRVLGNRADAEDAAQNCFLKLAQSAARLKAPIGGWLHTVAVRTAIDMLRGETARRKRERAVALRTERSRPSDASPCGAPWAEVRGEVDAAIATLPERLRTPIVLHFLEGRTQADVATELGILPPAVSKRLRRGVQAMRRRLKRAGIVTSLVALPTMLSGSAVEAAPATLVANLGKLALAGPSGAKAATAGGTCAVLKVATLLALGAAAGAGTLAVHHAAKPPHPKPVAAAIPAPPVEKKPRRAALTTETVLDAELTLPAKSMRINELGKLIKEQLGVYLACHRGMAERVVRPGPGQHKVRDVLAGITASAPLTTEVLADKERVFLCLWQKPNEQALAEMTKLARSDVVLERCIAARWLEPVGGREALVQLLKMLADPDARVRYFAAGAVAEGWAGSRWVDSPSAVPCVAPEGTRAAVVKALKTQTWRETRRSILQIACRLRDPNALPILKKRLEEMSREKPARDRYATKLIITAVAEIGGPEAEGILAAAMNRLWAQEAGWAMRGLGTLGSDGAIAWLGKQVDAELKKGKAGRFYALADALAGSRSPAAVRELIRILNRPGIARRDAARFIRLLSKFAAPEAEAACLAKVEAAIDPEARRMFEMAMVSRASLQEERFKDLAKGGAVGRNLAIGLSRTCDPRLVPVLVEILDTDETTLGANGANGRAVKEVAIRTLGQIGTPEAEKALIALVERGEGTPRAMALLALGDISFPKAREVLRAALQAPDAFSQKWAAKALAKRPDPVDLDILLACARKKRPKKDRGVAGIIWTSVAAIGGERAARELAAAVARGDKWAARPFVSSADPHCIRAVRDVFAGDDARQRGLLLDGFYTLSPTVPLSAYYAVNVAVAGLPAADEVLKTGRMYLLGWTQDPRATDALGRLLVNAEESKTVRFVAARALFLRAIGGRSSDPAAVEPMRHALEHDADEGVKRQAKSNLMEWGVIPFEKLPPHPPRKPDPPKKPDPIKPPDEREFPPPPDV